MHIYMCMYIYTYIFTFIGISDSDSMIPCCQQMLYLRNVIDSSPKQLIFFNIIELYSPNFHCILSCQH